MTRTPKTRADTVYPLLPRYERQVQVYSKPKWAGGGISKKSEGASRRHHPDLRFGHIGFARGVGWIQWVDLPEKNTPQNSIHQHCQWN